MTSNSSEAPIGRKAGGGVVPPLSNDFPTVPSIATGKPYDWELPGGEVRVVALPPDAMAERADSETAAALQAAVVRAAALFTVISRTNGYEGRDPALVTDDLDCGLVAGLLGIDIDMLARVLVALRAKGLVSPHESGGLLLRDIAALDRLSDAGQSAASMA